LTNRPLNLIWRRTTLDYVLEGYFIKEILLGALPRPVRQILLEGAQTITSGNDFLFVTLDTDNVPQLNTAIDAGCRNVGVLHLGDEQGRGDHSFYCRADYVLRMYWTPEPLLVAESQMPPILWVPNGYRTGTGPIDPAHTLPFGERGIELFFAGSLHERVPGHERQIMASVVRQAQLPCLLIGTSGFAQGLGTSSYSGLLGNAKFALVPGGNSPETLRLYEALENGAIPIIRQSGFIAAPTALGALGAPPFVILDDWASLPTVYAEMAQTPIAVWESRRLAVIDWWTRFKTRCQNRVRDVIEASFTRHSVSC